MTEEEIQRQKRGEGTSQLNLTSIIPGSKFDFIPLQPADLVAYEWWKFTDRNIVGGHRVTRKSMLAIKDKFAEITDFKGEDSIRKTLKHFDGLDLSQYLS
jgi:hypothetical protein